MNTTIDSPAPLPQAKARKSRKNNPEQTRDDILQAAIAEFVAHGLSGARVDAIAERTKTSKRMIYYYFGSKEQLYVEVLEKLYGDIRTTEGELHLADLEPHAAIRRLIEFTFDHHDRNVDFVRIVCNENILNGENVKQSETIHAQSQNIIKTIDGILRRGEASGVFREGVDPVDLHMLMTSFCFHRVSNRHTLGAIFKIDLAEERIRQRHKLMICDSVLRYLQR